MKNFLPTILFLFYTLCALGQPTQTLRGRVVDRESKYPLIGATIQLLDKINKPITGTVADTLGRYRLASVPVGRQTVLITLVGYKDALLNNIMVDAGRETILDVDLVENTTELATVTVKAQRSGDRSDGPAKNEMAIVSARQFTVDEADRYTAVSGGILVSWLNWPTNYCWAFLAVSTSRYTIQWMGQFVLRRY